jgi:soluble lytic murein transglycosylase-like protein
LVKHRLITVRLELRKFVLYYSGNVTGRVLMMRLGGCLLVIGLAFPLTAIAEPLTMSSKSNSAIFKSQLKVLDTRAASQYSNAVRLKPPHAIVPGTPEALAMAGNYQGPYLDTARSAAARHNIPEHIFLRLVLQESGWNAQAVSHKGAIGLAQLMPETAQLMRVDPRDPAQNLNGGAKYLRKMFDRFGSWKLALAAYNAGPEAVAKYRGVPPYAETQNYVRSILGS